MFVVLHFQGGPRDGSALRVSDKTLASNEFVERRFPAKRSTNEYLYQSQAPWDGAEKDKILHYLGVVQMKE